MARKRSTQATTENPATESAAGEPRTSRRRKGRRPNWLGRLLVLLLLLAALIAAAPTLATRTPLQGPLLQWVCSRLQLQIEAESITVGWLSTGRVTKLVVRDLHGQPLLQAESLEIGRSLLELLQDSGNLGTISLQRPQAQLVISDTSNNWLEALRPLLSGESSGSTPQLELKIEDGQLHVQDDRQLRSWDFGPLQAHVVVDDTTETPLQVDLATEIPAPRGRPGRLTARVSSTDMQLKNGRAEIQTQALSLAAVQSTLASLLPGVDIDGQMLLDCTLAWSLDQQRQQLAIRALELENFVGRWPGLAAGDVLQLQQLTGSGALMLERGRLSADALKVQSDVASLHASGEFELAGPKSQGLGPQDKLSAAAQIDLAKLAALLPRTLRIREDTRIDSGLVSATLSSQAAGPGRQWLASLDAKQLAATANGRQVRWDQPVQLSLDATQQGAAWTVRTAKCQSSFLNFAGSGTPAAGRLDGSVDLNRLRNELSQLVNLDQITLAGTAATMLSWQQGPQSLEAQGRLDLDQLQLVLPGKAPLTEPQLAVLFTAKGQPGPYGMSRIEQAKFTVQAATDQLVVELLQPLQPSATASYPLRMTLQGELSRWLMRAAVLTGNPQLQGDGQIAMSGELAIGGRQIVVSSSELAAKPCRIEGLGLRINEPELKASVRGAYDWQSGRWQGGETTLVSSTIAARCDNLLLQQTPDGPAFSGDVAYRGDLLRTLELIAFEEAPTRQFQGAFNGQLRLTQQQGTTQFDIRQRLEPLVVLQRDLGPAVLNVSTGSPWREVWREPFLEVAAQGDYSPAERSLTVQHFEAAADSVKVTVKGSVGDLPGRLNAALDGVLDYDLQRLTAKLRPLMGDALQLRGVSQKPIAIRGPLLAAKSAGGIVQSTRPLVPLELTAAGSLQWDAASFEGFPVGPGEIRSSLAAGLVSFEAVEIPVSQGKLHVAPTLDLRTANPLLSLPAGPLVENLQISPDMSRTWLKYVAPLLADSTRIQGAFSANVRQTAVPLRTPAAATIQGDIIIHGAQAGPGPLAQQLLGWVKQAESIARGVKNGTAGQGLNLDNALDLLGNGGIVGNDGRFNPQQALGGLLGGAANNAAAQNAAAAQNVASWIELPEQTIGFELVNGRVHHRNMRMRVDDVELRSTGSVGLDQSMEFEVEMPIPAEWLGNEPRLAALQGQVLRLPIRGTLRSPRVDGSAIQQLGQQMLQSAAQGAGDGVNRALRGMFNRPPAKNPPPN